MCRPSLSDVTYLLARWQQRWSDQREAAWRLRGGGAEASGSKIPRTVIRAAEDTKQYGFPLERSVEQQLLRRARVGVRQT